MDVPRNISSIIRSAPPERSLDKAAQSARTLLFFIFLEFVLLWLLCLALVVHLRYNRAAALRGDAAAARKLVLPAFEPLLVVLGIFNGVFGIGMGVLLAVDYYAKRVPVVHLETYYSAHQYGLVLLVLFLLEKSVSFPALRRCALLALLLSGYTIPYIWWVTAHGDPTKQRDYIKGLHVLRAIVLLIYVYVIVRPPSRASRRVLREFAVYTIVRYLITTTRQVMTTYPSTRESAKYAMYATLAWVTLSPLVIWRVLLADTRYWRGIGHRASEQLPDLFQRKHQLVFEGGSAGDAAQLHDVIEAHRHDVIDFAYLDLRQSLCDEVVASTASITCRVYDGVYRGKHRVAVKAYEPSTLTREVVAGFSRETELCSALAHPNVVAFVGLCVAPPTICLVFERCECSLHDLLHSEKPPVSPDRQELLVRVGYMLDAARAVAYLHSLTPMLVHRAIEPASFLVDAAGNVKLANFSAVKPLSKFGDSVGPHSDAYGRGAVVHALDASHGPDRDVWLQMPPSPSTRSRVGTDSMNDDLLDSPPSPSQRSQRALVRAPSSYYIAPEVLHHRAAGAAPTYDQSADVFALAVTLWDIANAGNNVDRRALATHRRAFESVLGSTCARPALDPALPHRLRDAIQRAWQEDANLRPSAQTLVSMLQDVQETLAAPVAVAIMDELQLCFFEPEASSRTIFAGADATDVLLERGFVSTVAEAERMGNALMDAGLLHHARHAHRFESSAAVLYYFAVDSSAVLRQLIRSTRDSTARLSSSFTPMLSSPTSQLQNERGECMAGQEGRWQYQQQQHNHHRSASQSSSSFFSVPVGEDCACARMAQRLAADAKLPVWRRLHHKSHFGPRRPRPHVAVVHEQNDDDGAVGG